jgi:uncharacterized protein (DUF2336 family)
MRKFFSKSEQMSPSRSIIDEMEATLRSGSTTQRTEVLRRVTDLFLGRTANISEDQISLFGNVMNHLISHIQGRALAELSARLAPVIKAPAEVIRRLAQDDDISIAGPVLNESEQLTDDDLVEIAKSKSQDHLVKIAGRSRLNEAVTDVLVDRGESQVTNEVAANRGACFSNSAFSKLVMCADGDDRLTEIIACRSDIPPLLFRQLLIRATNMVRERLLTSNQPELREKIRKVLTDISDQMSKAVTPRHYTEAKLLVSSFSQDTALTKSKVLEFAQTNRIAESIVALSVLSAVPIDLVDCLVHNPGHFGLIVLCKAIGLDWTVVHAVMLARCRSVLPLETQDACEEYQKLSISSAQKLLRFWQVRQMTPTSNGS